MPKRIAVYLTILSSILIFQTEIAKALGHHGKNRENPYLAKIREINKHLTIEKQSPSESSKDLSRADKAAYHESLKDKTFETLESIERRFEAIPQHLHLFESEIRKSDHFHDFERKSLVDPHFPYNLKTKPEVVSLPPALLALFEPHMQKGQIKLEYIATHYLTKLSFDELNLLLGHLNGIPIKVKWWDKDGQTRSGKKYLRLVRMPGWSKVNAAAALGLYVTIQKKAESLIDMLAIATEAMSLGLQGEAAALIDTKVAAEALVKILSQVNSYNSRQIALSAKTIAQIYIEYWAGENADQLILALTQLVIKATEIISCLEKPFSMKQKGILLGALLGGAMAHAHKVRSQDEQRLWITNSISNLAWASTAIIGALPVANSVSCGVAGTLSIAAVVWSVVYNKVGARNFMPKIREVEGHIEFSALELVDARHNKKAMIAILEVLAWMRATIHINGFYD